MRCRFLPPLWIALLAAAATIALPVYAVAPCSAVLFADGFESGDTSAWGPSAVPCAPDGRYSYRLDESTPSVELWTRPVAHKPRSTDVAPTATGSGIALSAARREFEPAQLVLGPVAAGGDAYVTVAPFPDLGSDQRLELAVVRYEANGWGERLEPLPSDGRVSLSATRPTPLWLTVFVPPDAPSGLHATELQLVFGGGVVEVPVELRVFDFTLPLLPTFKTQFNLAFSEPQHEKKQLLFEHRLTPKAVPWPSGLAWDITWDSSANPQRCTAFWDEPTEPDPYSIGWLAPRYILGVGWNGVGFPSAMAFQFVNNTQPRPSTFCSIPIGDAAGYGSAAYNAEWGDYLAALAGYLDAEGMLGRSYYYVMNEPQGPTDYDLAAHLCRLSRQAAPTLSIAISEEPKPQIAEHAAGGCGYDIWIAHVEAYRERYGLVRQALGEEVWLYSLPHDTSFNPTVTDRQGMDVRILPWIAWRYRALGWAYYDGGSFLDGWQPGIRLELLREGIEDWEYLVLANGGQLPAPGGTGPADSTALSVAKGMLEWNRDPDAHMALRDRLGRFIEGQGGEAPRLFAEGRRRRGSYYLNFQDPTGAPSADPLVVRGKSWMKVGWQAWSDFDGYGWTGQFVDNPGIARYGYETSATGYDAVERSYVYDDYGRANLFELDLENGRYLVRVGVGRAGRGSSDPHNLTVEGQEVLYDELLSDVVERTVEVELEDGRLSLVMGGWSDRLDGVGNWSYTFLAYLEIEPVD